jgi:citrate lyase subunit beta/citryl-CoA lyase
MFVPGHRQRMIDKSFGVPVDAVMLDLEDGVAPAEKDAARTLIAAALDGIAKRPAAAGARTRMPARYVRVNAVGHERMDADLAVVVRAGLDGIVLPKVENAQQVGTVDDLLGKLERSRGLSSGSVRIVVAIESPNGLFSARELAASSPRVAALMFGAEDFSRELGLPLRRQGEALDLLYARSSLAIAAAAGHVQSVDGVWTDLQDSDGLNTFAAQSRRLGFSGMAVIHPSQVLPVNAAFTPAADEIDYCRRVVNAFDEATARGDGSVSFGGQLLDYPIVERARRTLALAESLEVGQQ